MGKTTLICVADGAKHDDGGEGNVTPPFRGKACSPPGEARVICLSATSSNSLDSLRACHRTPAVIIRARADKFRASLSATLGSK